MKKKTFIYVYDKKGIPGYMLYEMYEKKIVRYAGYQDVIEGLRLSGELEKRNDIQSMIYDRLTAFLNTRLSKSFDMVLARVIEINLGNCTVCVVDLAIGEEVEVFRAKKPYAQLDTLPKYVIDIDIKASEDDIEDPITYCHDKIDRLLAHGIEYVIWIFSTSKKIIIAQKGKNWEIIGWDQSFAHIENIEINLNKLLEGMLF